MEETTVRHDPDCDGYMVTHLATVVTTDHGMRYLNCADCGQVTPLMGSARTGLTDRATLVRQSTCAGERWEPCDGRCAAPEGESARSW